MYRYVKSTDYVKHPYPWGSSEYTAKVSECVDKLSNKYPGANIQNFNGIIYVIEQDGNVDMYVVDDWGHCGIVYGSLWEYVTDFLKDGGDINLVTFTDKLGNVYTPYKNRKSINVTFPNGSSIDMPRGKAESMYLQNNEQGIYDPNFWGNK